MSDIFIRFFNFNTPINFVGYVQDKIVAGNGGKFYNLGIPQKPLRQRSMDFTIRAFIFSKGNDVQRLYEAYSLTPAF